MNEVGHLERLDVKGRPTVYTGEVLLATLAGDIYLIPHPAKRSDQSPDFAIKFRARADQPFVAMGNAWIKKTTKGKPVEFFSLTFDGPTLPAPIYVAAFPDDQQPGKPEDKPSQFTIRWQRQRGGAAAAQATGAALSEALADEIPWN